MKLLKLELLNLASLDKMEGEVINFNEGALGESTIFSIVGPTGSGKSTILDAICLALYNRAPRYPRKKGDRGDRIEVYGDGSDDEKNRLAPTDGRNILTRGKKFGYSKLTFLANDGSVYRAEWSVRMKVKNYEDAVTSLYKLVNKEGRLEEEEANWKDLPTIIGLDYDQFLRTVLIAQGSFANFLTAKENERYELLEKLVGCEDMYTRIANAIKEQKDAAMASCNSIKNRLSDFENDDLNEEQLEALVKRIAELELADKKRREDLDAVKKSLAWYTEEEKQKQGILQAEVVLAEASKGVEEWKVLSERLARHDAALQAISYYKDIKDKERTIVDLQVEEERLHKDMSAMETFIGELEKELECVNKALLQAMEEWEKQHPHINRARTILGELDSFGKVAEDKRIVKEKCAREQEEAEKDVETNKKSILEKENLQELAIQEYEKLKRETDQKEQELVNQVLLAQNAYHNEAVKLEGKDMDSLQKAKELASSHLNDLDEALCILDDLDIKKAEKQKCEDENRMLAERNQKLKEELCKLDVEVLQAELETLQKSYTLMTSENWSLHRQDLSEGNPCPLCGSVHHPYRLQEAFVPVVSDLSHLISQKGKLLEDRKTAKKDFEKELNNNEGKLDSNDRYLKRIGKEISDIENKWSDLKMKHQDWPADVSGIRDLRPAKENNLKKASEALTEYCTVHDHVGRLQKARETKEAELKKYTENSKEWLEKAQEKKIASEKDWITEKGKEESLSKQLKEKKDALEEAVKAWNDAQEAVVQKKEEMQLEIGNQHPDAFEKELTKTRTDAEAKVDTKKKDIERCRQQLEGRKGAMASINEQIGKNQVDKMDNENLLKEWLKNFNACPDTTFAFGWEDIVELYMATDNWEQIRKEKEKRIHAYTSASTMLRIAEKMFKEHQNERPADEKPVLEVRKKELEENDMTELVEAKARLQRYEEAKKQIGSMYEQKQQAEQVLNDWAEISDAVGGGDGKLLRKIAQCYTLKFLIEHANAEISKFNSRYELQQVKNSLGIRVIDHDRAYDVRDTTSLSGGETFIVSLGLALGLSSLSSRNISFGNLFIDEGFGTLDPDTLATVIDSLSMLQNSQGKKVGVISHTDTMSERITTQIRIIRNGHSGSSHIEIYP